MALRNSLQKQADALTLPELEAARKRTSAESTGFAYPPAAPVFYVKFGNQSKSLTNMEARTQEFVYTALKDLPDVYAPRVPRIFRVVEGRYLAYVIMELVHEPTLLELSETRSWEEQQPYLKQIARAIDVLLTIPVVGDVPGPCGGGVIQHPLFRDGQAPAIFPSTAALQGHINAINSHRNAASSQITLESCLHVVYSDCFPGNFVLPPDGSLWILDFGHAGLLPLSFQAYALSYPFPRSRAVARAIGGYMTTVLPRGNLELMRRAHDRFSQYMFGFGLKEGEMFHGDDGSEEEEEEGGEEEENKGK
ncbi:hypothetical protein LLEC1_06398 [Akanthomyces lecanii]|uniref:Aminoglycoside phosphotransferase domain-containing protein n=1 Tax=Cordyceps confragosa TaxID=2714763 RepID=A0A179IT53_CORDF|nr:hypothetical protein LLEC1_06398 [Akanthomyces lecanii]